MFRLLPHTRNYVPAPTPLAMSVPATDPPHDDAPDIDPSSEGAVARDVA